MRDFAFVTAFFSLLFFPGLLQAQNTGITLPLTDPGSTAEVSPDLKYFIINTNWLGDKVRYDRYNVQTGFLDTSWFFQKTPDTLQPAGCIAFAGSNKVIFSLKSNDHIWLTDSVPNQPRTYTSFHPTLKSEYFYFDGCASKNLFCLSPSRKNYDFKGFVIFDMHQPDQYQNVFPENDVIGRLQVEMNPSGEVITATYGGKLYIYYPDELIFKITQVDSGTVAERDGLKVNDVLLSVNNEKISVIEVAKPAVAHCKILRGNDTIMVKMNRGTQPRFGYSRVVIPNHIIDDTSVSKLVFTETLSKEYFYYTRLSGMWDPGFVPRNVIYSVKEKKIVYEVAHPYEKAVITSLKDHIMVSEIVQVQTKEKYRINRTLLPFKDLTKKKLLPQKLSGYSVFPSRNNDDILIFYNSNGEWGLYSLSKKRIIQKISTLSLSAPGVLSLNPKRNGFCIANNAELVNIDMQGKISREKIGSVSHEIEQLQHDTTGKYVFTMSSADMVKWNLNSKVQEYNWYPEDKYGNTNMIANAPLTEVLYTYANINSGGVVKLNGKTGEFELLASVHLHQEFPPPTFMTVAYDRFKKNNIVVGLSNGVVKSLSKAELEEYTPEREGDWNPVLSIHFLDKHRAIAARSNGTLLRFTDKFENDLADTLIKDELNCITLMQDAKKEFIFAAGKNKITLQKSSVKDLLPVWTMNEAYAITDMKLNWDKKFLVATCTDGKIRFISTEDGKEIIQLYFFAETNDFLVTTPDGYFYSSREIAKKLNFKTDAFPLSNKEGDVRFNRPDIILERLGYADPELNRKLKKLWEKRMRKNGFSAELKQYNNIRIHMVEYDQSALLSSKKLEATVHYTDTDKKAGRLLIYHNGTITGEVPLQQNESSVKVMLEMMNGDNEFSFLIQPVDESVSHRYDISIYNEELEIEKTNPTFYFIGLGCNTYSNPAYNLNYAEKDVKDLSALFKSMQGDAYKELLVTGNALTPEVSEKIRAFVAGANPHDMIVLSFSGHGVLDNEMNFYLSSAQTDFSNPASNSIPVNMIENALNESKCVNRLLLLDACHSGEVDKQEMAAQHKTEKMKDVKFRGTGAYVSGNAKDENMLMNSFFNDVRTATGMNIISSSDGAELSLESAAWENGLFTYALKKALTDKWVDTDENGEVTVSELATYLNASVAKLSNGVQNPGIRYLNPNNDFVIYRVNR